MVDRGSSATLWVLSKGRRAWQSDPWHTRTGQAYPGQYGRLLPPQWAALLNGRGWVGLEVFTIFEFVELFIYFWKFYELKQSDIRECLRLDPDHKKCSDYYKMLRKLNKLIERMRKSHDEQNYKECVSTAETIKTLDVNSLQFYLQSQAFICKCLTKAQDSTAAIKQCSEFIRRNPNDADVLYNRAQAYILEEQLEDGIYTKKLTRYLMNLTRT